MPLLFPTQGRNLALEMIVNKTAPQSLVLKLYTNNITPAVGDTEATYTEAAGNGYASIALAGASWGVAAAGSIAFAQQTFTFTGALGDVYGYFIIQTTSGKLVYAERFSGAPYNIANNGDQIKVTPTVTAT